MSPSVASMTVSPEDEISEPTLVTSPLSETIVTFPPLTDALRLLTPWRKRPLIRSWLPSALASALASKLPKLSPDADA